MEVVLKKCTCCGLEFPKTKEYFFSKTSKKETKNGLSIYHLFRSNCKSCHSKKNDLNRIKKRCEEMNCDISDYRENWKKQYSKTRTKDIKAKSELTTNQYHRFLKSGLKEVDLFKKEIEKSKDKRNKRLSEMSKQSRKYFTSEDKKNALNRYNKNERDKISDCYVANVLIGKKIKELNPEIIETKRLLIKIKRELKNG